MKWLPDPPQIGDIVRVKLGQIYHYGVYLSDEEVIAFGMPPVGGLPADGRDVCVVSTDIQTFLCGNFLETGKPSFTERRRMRPREEIAAYARAKIGMRGYDLLRNNCEHFAYECAFGSKQSAQVDAVRAMWRSLPRTEVYVAPLPAGGGGALFPEERQREIDGCTNEKVKAQKAAVWRLLEFAMKRTFGIELRETDVRREQSGKWVCSQCWFSLSHTDRYAAVAVSRAPVGVDIEEENGRPFAALLGRIATPKEQERGVPDERSFLKLWTAKESLFKRAGKEAFAPSETETEGESVLSCFLPHEKLVLSVAAEQAQEALLHTVTADLSAAGKADYIAL